MMPRHSSSPQMLLLMALSLAVIGPGGLQRSFRTLRTPASTAACHWETARLEDEDLPDGSMDIPVLVCASLERQQITRYQPSRFPWEISPRPLPCAFIPAEIITDELTESGTLVTRLQHPGLSASLFHLREDLERLSRGEEPVCLAPDAALIRTESLAPAAPAPTPTASPSPAVLPPKPTFKRLDQQFSQRLSQIELATSPDHPAFVCVVVDHSDSMDPYVQQVIQAFRDARPSVPIQWSWVHGSAPHNQELRVFSSSFTELLSELGNHRSATPIERITESITACENQLKSRSGSPREIWVISDEIDLPGSASSQPENQRTRLRQAGIALRFLDPVYQSCPAIARDGLKDSTRADWIVASAQKVKRFDERCGTEIARAAIYGYLGPQSWKTVLPHVNRVLLEPRALLLVAALRDPDSGLSPAVAIEFEEQLRKDIAQTIESGRSMGGLEDEVSETEDYMNQLLRQIEAAHRMRFRN